MVRENNVLRIKRKTPKYQMLNVDKTYPFSYIGEFGWGVKKTEVCKKNKIDYMLIQWIRFCNLSLENTFELLLKSSLVK